MIHFRVIKYYVADSLKYDQSQAKKYFSASIWRRMSTFNKNIVTIFYQFKTLSDEDLSIVLATDEGDLENTFELLRDISKSEPLSPTIFTRSIISAPLSQISLNDKITGPQSTVLAHLGHSFGAGLIQSVARLQDEEEGKILLIGYDEKLIPEYACFDNEFSKVNNIVSVLIEKADATNNQGNVFSLSQNNSTTVSANFFYQLLENQKSKISFKVNNSKWELEKI